MSLLKKFLKPGKPKWQHDDPDIRRQALTDLDQQQLTEFLAKEPEAELRQLAVQRINDEALLESLLAHNHDDVRQAARLHWLSLLMPAGASLDSLSSAVLVRVAGLTNDDSLRLQAIEKITDQQERLAIAREHPVARVRLAAADGIHELPLLQQLLDHAQGKDKAVYRLCKDRIAAARANAEAEAAVQQKINQLIDQASYLNRIGYNPEFNGRLQVLGRQRDELLERMSDTQRSALDQQLEQARDLLKQHQQEEQQRAEAEQRAQQAQQQQTHLLQQLEDIVSTATGQPAEQLQTSLQQLDEQWRHTQADSKPTAEQLRQYENQLQTGLTLQRTLERYQQQHSDLEQWLQQDLPNDLRGLQNTIKSARQWLEQFHWPAGIDQPTWLAALQGKYQLAQSKLEQLSNQQQSRVDDLTKQLDKLDALLEDGHLKDANRLYGNIHNSMRQIDGRSAQAFQHRLRAAGARLGEMRDWQGYVTTPKKEALCEQMEALIDADFDPETLANEIQALQEEWKTLNSSQPDRELWERFQAAGDKAFEPCRAWFAEAARQREQHINNRNQLIEELTTYEANLDWDNADWKVVQKTLEAAREAFRSYSPVERAAHRDTQARFNDICDRIYAHIKAEYDRNLALKEQLIEQATRLLEREDLTDIVDEVKTLQQQWKAIGVTPRAPDQKLWKQFRSQCDAIFARLDEQRQQRRADIDDKIADAEQLIQQAQQLIEEDINEAVRQQRLQELETAFAAIELPRAAHQRLRKALSDVSHHLQQQQQQQQLAADRQRWQGLVDRLQALATADESLWQQADKLPAGYQQAAFEQRWQQASEMQQATDEARDLCIHMEVLAGLESPADEQNRRMEIQVQRLAQGMGQATDINQQRLQLVSQWLTVSASPEQQQRFVAAIQASL